MIAVDTSIVVRLLTGDDPGQQPALRSLFESDSIWIAKTVLLETGWLLRSLYGFEDAAIRTAFTKLLGLNNVTIEDERSVSAALALTANNLEFAEAMHLSSRPPHVEFVSLDDSLVQRARDAGVTSINGIAKP
jgi:predicted nucleic-acid-binding protein